jgi:uracil-DNA glycosylase
MESAEIQSLMNRIRECRICRDCPRQEPGLPHEPRPVLQASQRARICIASQAPGNKAHQKGLPFYDPSGVRLREWLDVTDAEFYDPERFAIIPMGFCFPGYDAKGGDLPPRRECAETWHDHLFAALPDLELILVIGQYSQRYHLPERHRRKTLTDTVANWREILEEDQNPAVLPMPHPSWRNNAWLRRNPWFGEQLLPELQHRVRRLIS